jgi:hypothetical protein
VPLRVEVGRREADGKTVTVADRLGLKRTIGPADVDQGIVAALADFDERLRAKAEQAFAASFTVARSLDELRGSTTVRILAWCGAEACGHKVEEAIEGALLGTPEGRLPIDPGTPGGCVGCGARESRWALAGQPL